MKILAIQFRYLGDAVLMTPALRAIKEHFADVELHVLVAQEVAPILQHLPWVEHVWAFPRKRGSKTIVKGWPIVRALRREHFDRSVDFAGSDRGAILSRLCGARIRLAPLFPGRLIGRRQCYTETITPVPGVHQVFSNLHILSAWGIPIPDSPQLDIRADPSRVGIADQILPPGAILCHLSASQTKKEWPLPNWSEFYEQATAAGHKVVFSTGITPRETSLLEQFQKIAPKAQTLSVIPELATFLAVLRNARLFVSGDTSPLHFAAALGVPTISLFGPSIRKEWAPLGRQHRALEVESCMCRRGDTAVCLRQHSCMEALSPEAVLCLVSSLTSEPR